MNHEFIFTILTILTFEINAQHIVYLNGLFEHSSCEVDTGIYGRCRKTSDCMTQFDSYRNNQTVLKVCSFDKNHSNTLICCHDDLELEVTDDVETFEELDNKSDDKEAITMNPKKRSEIIDFTICQQRFLRFRKQAINIAHFEDAFWTGKIPQTEDNCIRINNLNRKFSPQNFWDGASYGCEYQNGEFRRTKTFPHFTKTKIIQRAFRPNMATIGLKNANGGIKGTCVGSILTPRFVLTAAYCEYFGGKKVDFIKVGTKHAGPKNNINLEQQIKIRQFITHPDYIPSLAYNDIAIIKTVERINFNKFVVPSCIADFNVDRIGVDSDWKVGGYGHPEDGLKPKIMLEMKVEMMSNEECNSIYAGSEALPNGITESQFCARNPNEMNEELHKFSNTCFGDSGSFLQYNSAFEKFPKNFTSTFLSKYFLTSNILGLAPAQAKYGLETPFVFTKISYYIPWIKLVIESH